MSDPQAHWDKVYQDKGADEVSWFQPEPTLSLKLIRRTGLARDAALVDVGGGASTLVDYLLNDGFRDLSVMDLAEAALAKSKARLGPDAGDVDWITHDVTTWRPPRRYQLWHDRAVLHFLTQPADQQAYARTLFDAVAPDGCAIIGGFAPGGPAKCSGLEIVQHDGESLERLVGGKFRLTETHAETHLTPWGAEQAFRYHVFRRVRD